MGFHLHFEDGKDPQFLTCLHVSHNLNSFKGGYIGDYIGDYYMGY